MKKILIVCYTALALAFIVPHFLRAEPEEPSAAPVTVPGAAAPPIAADEPSPPPREVRETISVLVGDEPRELDMTDYLTGVVAAEMPANFEEEALRAQAVAARTYALYCAAAHRHADAEVCADSGCCQAWLDDAAMRERLGKDYDYYAAKLRRAVETTAGEYLTYEGAPAFAAFHSSSAGATEDSGRVWNAVPYLVSVPSPESADTVPGYVSTVDVAPLDLRDSILSFCPDADFTGDAGDFSPCFLMTRLFDACGWAGPGYMQLSRAMRDISPLLHTNGLFLHDGVLTSVLSDTDRSFYRSWLAVQYYREHVAAYS